MQVNEITEAIIRAAIEVHRGLGPGLLESAYQRCLRHELTLCNLQCEYEKDLPVSYKGLALDCGYRLDFVVMHSVIVEVKSVKEFDPINDAQLMTYLRLGGYQAGLLLNFNVKVLKDGIRRKVLGFRE